MQTQEAPPAAGEAQEDGAAVEGEAPAETGGEDEVAAQQDEVQAGGEAPPADGEAGAEEVEPAPTDDAADGNAAAKGDVAAPESDAPAQEDDVSAPDGDAPAQEVDAPAPESSEPAEGDIPASSGDAGVDEEAEPPPDNAGREIAEPDSTGALDDLQVEAENGDGAPDAEVTTEQADGGDDGGTLEAPAQEVAATIEEHESVQDAGGAEGEAEALAEAEAESEGGVPAPPRVLPPLELDGKEQEQAGDGIEVEGDAGDGEQNAEAGSAGWGEDASFQQGLGEKVDEALAKNAASLELSRTKAAMAEGLASESMNDLAGRVQELESALQEAQSARAAAEERLWEQQEELSRLQVGSRVMLGYDKHERMHTDFPQPRCRQRRRRFKLRCSRCAVESTRSKTKCGLALTATSMRRGAVQAVWQQTRRHSLFATAVELKAR